MKSFLPKLATEVASNKKNYIANAVPVKVRSFAKKIDDSGMYNSLSSFQFISTLNFFFFFYVLPPIKICMGFTEKLQIKSIAVFISN